jgi:polyhydroxyalkanoate synthesis regulator phasin
MAQNPYLQNLLGINQGGTGLYGYNYTLPTYNNLLSQGLTEAQIAQYDPNFSTFNQFPYKAKPNPQQNFSQYEVVPQVEGQVPSSEEDTEVNIDYGNQTTNNNNSFDTITTQRYGDIRDNSPEVLNLSNVPLTDMSESEIMDYGIRKGYIGEDGSLKGPQQFSDQTLPPGVLGFAANMASGPIQMANDRQYEQFTNALQKKNMFLGRGVDSPSFASFSPSYKQALSKANFYNDKLGNMGSQTNLRIPGTQKSVKALINQYAPVGAGMDFKKQKNKDPNQVQYHTSTGGYYNGNGKFVNHYGQQQAFGSLQDAVDTIMAASQSGNVSTVPDKFLTNKYKDTIKALVKRGDFSQDQGNEIITAINNINNDGINLKKKLRKRKITNLK